MWRPLSTSGPTGPIVPLPPGVAPPAWFIHPGMSQASGVVVATKSGKIEGEQREAHVAFRGIPFAAPPIGSLRFRAPAPVEPWSGVRSTKQFGTSALQGAMFAPGVMAEGPTGEDCLYLNVFTPAVDGKKRAVMFFIHGGAFTVGSAATPLYDGKTLAEAHDVVLVTTNYRVGALGYLALGEHGASWGAVDNRGQLDQIAALSWVRDNIASFGGDPDNVTLFGESAGATAVCLLLAAPAARGLFKRAIAQSSWLEMPLPTAAQRESVTVRLLDALGLTLRESERLCDVPAADLMRAQAQVESNMSGWPHFVPVFDGALLPLQPRAFFESGEGAQVPLLIGSNRDEWNLFALASLPQWDKPLDDSELVARVARKLPASAAGAANGLLDAYRTSRRERGLAYGNRALLRAFEGDLRFRMPSLRFAELYSERVADTFVYLFTYESPALRGALGACHALELPFVFGTYDAPNQDKFAGSGEAVQQLSRTLMECWTSFAKTGAPSSASVPTWPAYELTKRPTLELGAEVQLVEDAYGLERSAWDGVI